MESTKEALDIVRYCSEQPSLFFQRIESLELFIESCQLRYRSYCKELHFLPEEKYQEGLESDMYDPYSTHFAASDSFGLVSTIRLIFDSPHGFPIEEYCRGKLNIDINTFSREQVAEVSRFIISNDFRRGHPGVAKTITYEMIHNMYLESKQMGIIYWIGVMERPLYLLLRRYGLRLDPIGEEVDVYGPVIPYLAKIEDLYRIIRQ